MNIDNLELELLDTNTDKTPMFLFHGNSSSASSFDTLLSSDLAAHFRLIAVSFPGHGNSPPSSAVEQHYSIEGFGNIIQAVVEYYGFDDYWILGRSVGGHAALNVVDRLKHLSGLILVSAPPVSNETLPLAFVDKPYVSLLFSGDISQQQVQQLSGCFCYSDDQHLRSRIEADICRTDPLFRARLGISIATQGVKDEAACLGRVDVPTVAFFGAEDMFLNQGYMSAVKSLVTESHIYQGCGHLVDIEKTGHLARDVLAFTQQYSVQTTL